MSQKVPKFIQTKLMDYYDSIFQRIEIWHSKRDQISVDGKTHYNLAEKNLPLYIQEERKKLDRVEAMMNLLLQFSAVEDINSLEVFGCGYLDKDCLLNLKCDDRDNCKCETCVNWCSGDCEMCKSDIYWANHYLYSLVFSFFSNKKLQIKKKDDKLISNNFFPDEYGCYFDTTGYNELLKIMADFVCNYVVENIYFQEENDEQLFFKFGFNF